LGVERRGEAGCNEQEADENTEEAKLRESVHADRPPACTGAKSPRGAESAGTGWAKG
jgi:hypothetical protein